MINTKTLVKLLAVNVVTALLIIGALVLWNSYSNKPFYLWFEVSKEAPLRPGQQKGLTCKELPKGLFLCEDAIQRCYINKNSSQINCLPK